MPFVPSPAAWPLGRGGPDARLVDLLVDDGPDIHLAGVPYDASVIGRKGTKDGPTGIREAFRFIAGHDNATGGRLTQRIQDHGDVDGLDESDVLATHRTIRATLAPLMDRRVVLLGGDHGLTYAHVAALADTVDGSIGIIMLDAHFDLRDYDGQPTSGTPFRRILEELDGRVRPEHLVEIGIRPYANAPSLADYAAAKGVRVHGMPEIERRGMPFVVADAMAALEGVEHIWLSIDIDGLDQSIASGCSAPGAGGLTFAQAEQVVRTVAADPRCRGVDVMEVAPSLDPTGNTCRTAAQLIASFIGASP